MGTTIGVVLGICCILAGIVLMARARGERRHLTVSDLSGRYAVASVIALGGLALVVSMLVDKPVPPAKSDQAAKKGRR
jgi:H+/Cl- antiporter ClcA